MTNKPFPYVKSIITSHCMAKSQSLTCSSVVKLWNEQPQVRLVRVLVMNHKCLKNKSTAIPMNVPAEAHYSERIIAFLPAGADVLQVPFPLRGCCQTSLALQWVDSSQSISRVAPLQTGQLSLPRKNSSFRFSYLVYSERTPIQGPQSIPNNCCEYPWSKKKDSKGPQIHQRMTNGSGNVWKWINSTPGLLVKPFVYIVY